MTSAIGCRLNYHLPFLTYFEFSADCSNTLFLPFQCLCHCDCWVTSAIVQRLNCYWLCCCRRVNEREWGGTSGEGALVLRLGGWGRSNNCCPATDPAFPTGGLADALAWWLGRSLREGRLPGFVWCKCVRRSKKIPKGTTVYMLELNCWKVATM